MTVCLPVLIFFVTTQELASASYDNTIRFFCEEVDDWQCYCTLDKHASTVWGLSFGPGPEPQLASCAADGSVHIWGTKGDRRSWELRDTLEKHPRPVYDVSWWVLHTIIDIRSLSNLPHFFDI
ncbi:unnamed protein product, partial [Ixodes pacificus]